MEIKILKIKIENFKKVKQFELELNGDNVNIYGDNETGKTTLVDAFTWCLFGKNSQWLSDTNFKIRPLRCQRRTNPPRRNHGRINAFSRQ